MGRYGYYVIDADGTGLVSLGDGDDVAWLPGPVGAAP